MFFQNFRRLLKLHPPPKWSAWLHDNAGSYAELKFCKADVHSYTFSGPCGAHPALVHHWRSGRPPIPISVSRKAPKPMIKSRALLYMYQTLSAPGLMVLGMAVQLRLTCRQQLNRHRVYKFTIYSRSIMI